MTRSLLFKRVAEKQKSNSRGASNADHFFARRPISKTLAAPPVKRNTAGGTRITRLKRMYHYMKYISLPVPECLPHIHITVVQDDQEVYHNENCEYSL